MHFPTKTTSRNSCSSFHHFVYSPILLNVTSPSIRFGPSTFTSSRESTSLPLHLTARITSNAILIANKYCPISFRTVDSVAYKKAMLLSPHEKMHKEHYEAPSTMIFFCRFPENQ